jgi:hypothetical protein
MLSMDQKVSYFYGGGLPRSPHAASSITTKLSSSLTARLYLTIAIANLDPQRGPQG